MFNLVGPAILNTKNKTVTANALCLKGFPVVIFVCFLFKNYPPLGGSEIVGTDNRANWAIFDR